VANGVVIYYSAQRRRIGLKQLGRSADLDLFGLLPDKREIDPNILVNEQSHLLFERLYTGTVNRNNVLTGG
jgi:hypothetical protein